MNRSIWLAHQDTSSAQGSLQQKYDVVIIGAGITGITTAFRLAGTGLSVALIESRSILSGVTGYTTGKLTAQHGIIYKKLIDTFGLEKAFAYAEANQWAIQNVRDTSATLSIDCDLAEETAHVFTNSQKQWEEFKDEYEAYQRLNLASDLHEELTLPFGKVNAIAMRGQCRFHPVKYLRGLLAEITRRGAHVSENVRALEVDENDHGVTVKTNLGEIQAERAVVATHYPIHDSDWFVAKLAPYRSYALAVKLETPALDGMYINEEEPMRSLRKHVDETGEYQLVGGNHHKVGQDKNTEEYYLDIENWARSTFRVQEIAFRWSTQDNWTPDGLPYVGKSPHRDRIWIATGFAGWGMTNGTVAGRIIADQILGNPNPWTATYDPGRMELAAIPKIVSENVNVASRLIGDRAKSAELSSLDELNRGEGGIVQLEDKRVAAYRDEQGLLTAVSPVCTHLGCQVAWNEAERSWDCPCHGSRFAITGEVLHGPATKPLERSDVAPPP